MEDKAKFPENCPKCGDRYRMSCRCACSQRWCINDHQWHRCTEHRTLVMGPRDHGKSGCSCGTELPMKKFFTVD